MPRFIIVFFVVVFPFFSRWGMLNCVKIRQFGDYMISIIISSANAEDLSAVKLSIQRTIGVPFELLVIENSGGRLGICEAYNQAAARARFELLCFMHEDILFMTQDWGRVVLQHFSDTRVSLLGVAGSTYKSLSPSMWVAEGILGETVRINIIQHFKYRKIPPMNLVVNPGAEAISRVASIDGLWMRMPKKIFP
ncbi:glycosyltransferase [Pedobacter aquatilis]|uniref:glycosyltransferase n=1 Tax=Pedobacter aquatilis TaxID=351343 RepID=UPI0025B2FFF8|nr:glycosyltransferase [Pedobacter aquatilis]MDN3588076.1 glycosyltransferase [Pedobacter aquatilis]